MNRLQLAILLVCSMTWSVNAAHASGIPIVKISAKFPVGNWAVEESTGRLFASVPSANHIVEYDSLTGKTLRIFDMPGGPLQLAIKSHWLIAACPQDKSLGVIDLKTDSVAGSVPLESKGLFGVFASKADNPYVYAVCTQEDGSPLFEIVQVDCKTKEVRKRQSLQGVQRATPIVHAAMSVDGKWLVTDARGQRSPSGAELISADEEAGEFKHAFYVHQDFGQIAADPSGRWWTMGAELYPIDLSASGLSASARRFAGSPVAIHPTRDLVASVVSPESLMLQAFSGGNAGQQISLVAGDQAQTPTAATSPLPGGSRSAPRARPPRRTSGGMPYVDSVLRFDLKHDRLIYASGDNAYLIDTAAAISAYPRRLAIAGTPRLDTMVGRPQHARLSVADGGRAIWTIESGPAFVRLSGAEITASPTAENAGHHEVVVKATRGELSDTINIALEVGVPAVEVDFQIEHMTLDPAGTTALVWGRKSAAGRRVGFNGANNEPMQFALVDLEGLKVLASKNVAAGIQQACLDDKYVYMALASGNVLYRLDRTDLTKPTRVFLTGQPSRIEALPGGQVAVKIMNSPFSSVVVYDRETLTRNAKHFAQMDQSAGIDQSPIIAERGPEDTLLFREMIVDAATGELRCPQEVNALPALADAAVRDNNMMMAGRMVTQRPVWSRFHNGQQLLNAQGTRVADINGTAFAISTFIPLAAGVRIEGETRSGRMANRSGGKRILEFHEVKLGEVIHTVDLGATEPGAGFLPQPYNGYGSPTLQITKDKVLYRDGSRIVVSAIPDEVRKKCLMPLAFKIPKVPVASVDQPVELQLATYGSEGVPSFSLTKEYEGLSIEASTGKLTVDVPKIWAKVLAGGRPLTPYFGGFPTQGQQPDTGLIFERLTGKPLEAGKMAYRLPIRVAVTNPAGESDELHFSLIVVAPRDQLERATGKLQAEQAAAQAKAKAEMMRRQQELARANAERMGQAGLPAGAGDADRMNQLEARVRRLEATLDAVLQKLDKMENERRGEAKRDPASK
jgi:hypothetical protein